VSKVEEGTRIFYGIVLHTLDGGEFIEYDKYFKYISFGCWT